MTATDELRRMLDERGVKWDGWGQRAYGRGTVYEGEHDTVWTADSGDLLSILCETTPEQAIEATLGRGTCHIVKTWSDSDYVDGWRYRCSECMCFIPVIERDPETGDVISAANYCPNCGRRVVE